MSHDNRRDALNSALENFAELLRILNEATTRAAGMGDQEMVERLARAKAATERSSRLVGELRYMLAPDDQGGQEPVA